MSALEDDELQLREVCPTCGIELGRLTQAEHDAAYPLQHAMAAERAARARELDAEPPTFRLQVNMPLSDSARCDRCEVRRREHVGATLACPENALRAMHGDR